MMPDMTFYKTIHFLFLTLVPGLTATVVLFYIELKKRQRQVDDLKRELEELKRKK